jgi:hypothetical protein
VSRYPGAIHKSFVSRKQAEDWLGVHLQGNSKTSWRFREILCNLEGQPSPSTGRSTAPSKKVSAHNTSTTKASPSSHPSHVRDPVVTTSLNVRPPPSEIVLSPEQKIVLERVIQKRNVFFTGSAGLTHSQTSNRLTDIIFVVLDCRHWKIGSPSRNHPAFWRFSVFYPRNNGVYRDRFSKHWWNYFTLLGRNRLGPRNGQEVLW